MFLSATSEVSGDFIASTLFNLVALYQLLKLTFDAISVNSRRALPLQFQGSQPEVPPVAPFIYLLPVY